MKANRFPPGTRVGVRGLRGEYRVYSHAKNGDVTVFGGPKGYASFRSVVIGRLVKRRRQSLD